MLYSKKASLPLLYNVKLDACNVYKEAPFAGLLFETDMCLVLAKTITVRLFQGVTPRLLKCNF